MLAIDGGRPVRSTPLPHSRPTIGEDDIRAVADVLRSDWLTTGPEVDRFERAFAIVAGTRAAVAVSSGTAALHASLHAIAVGPGDEVVVPTMTFPATANCVLYQGATPVFADVDPDTLLLDAATVKERLTPRTKAVIAVDYAGQPCDQNALCRLAVDAGIRRIVDASHSLGAADGDRPVGALAELSTFSLHAVKPITAGEGGVVTTDDAELAGVMRSFRQHGIDRDHRRREQAGTWIYQMMDLGYGYRLSDLQCALARSQLSKLASWVERRHAIARRYDTKLEKVPEVDPLSVRPGVRHAYHLYVVRLDLSRLRVDRAFVFRALRAEGIGVNVHFIPVHLHPFYRRRFGTRPGQFPVAEAAYRAILSLPIFPRMTDGDVDSVIAAVDKVIAACRR